MRYAISDWIKILLRDVCDLMNLILYHMMFIDFHLHKKFTKIGSQSEFVCRIIERCVLCECCFQEI